MAKRTSIYGEFWSFLRHHKTYWMIPIVVVLLLLAAVLVVAGTSAAPFIYTLF